MAKLDHLWHVVNITACASLVKRITRTGLTIALLPSVVVLAVLIGAGHRMLGVWGQAEAGQSAGVAEQLDSKRLVGRWVRPDGGYILEIREIAKDGKLKAGYFNPRPINVAKADLRRKGGALTIFVELRDINYPGSTYTLQYDPKSDRLKGSYFQAVEKQTFIIEFLRGK